MSAAKGGSQGSTNVVELNKLVGNNPGKTFESFQEYYSNIHTLIYAYEQIKSKVGNSTAGITPETLDDMDLKWFERMSKQQQEGDYVFKDIRRVQIPKKRVRKRPGLWVYLSREIK